MASVISAGTTSTTALNLSGDTTGVLQLQTNGTTAAMTIDTSQNVGVGTTTITSSAGWSPRLVLAGTDTALVVKGSSGQENTFGTSGGLYIDCLGHSTGTSNNIIFRNTSTNSSYSATERMRIDSSGNVGIGITPTSPVYSAWRVLQIGNSNSSGLIYGRTDSDKSMGLMLNGYYSGSAWLYRNTGAAASIEMADNIIYFQNAPSGTAGGALTWSERMRITSDGEVCVNATSAYGSARFYVNAPQPTAANWWVSTLRTASTSTATTMIAFIDGSNDFCGQVYIDPPSNSTVFSTSSDYRLKDNVAPMTDALAKVQALNPVTYTWKKSGKTGQGFIAHELQEIVPECVVGEKDAMRTYIDEEGNEQTAILPQMVDTSFLVATLTKAIQELNAKVEAQAAEIQALKGAR